LENFDVQFHTQKNHHIHIDSMRVLAAGGQIRLNGDLNGSSKRKLYFNPNMSFQNVDLDKLMFKFENFGQDHLVSEQLHEMKPLIGFFIIINFFLIRFFYSEVAKIWISLNFPSF
jgi:hypothetical protein